MKIRMKEEFKNDWITREAGERLRKRLVRILSEKRPVVLDFEGLVVASTSFFDEGFAKLSEEKVAPEDFEALITLAHLHPRDRELLVSLCKRRGFPIGKG